ncbi:structural protein [Synechococcus phage ACG-2014b]|uniref:Structural protein n=2 Tax=Synechococcus phage ACG-2014b TaxID=1493508 RepID=A0A0E3I0F5_9CAUD|nr:tail fiber protein [Synechococcus phage ACG-2014b]YP_009779659.1 tail fiber protein [Synechococcus phage ACG-2014b]AIX17253.1 structural protein [Synechococcus phage ACG-2014b]AIX17467.1 structural protein [Synechococcus phage ACG-2014b]AIX17682.1 structural protein [Synechococcus phage ACG-2014b]AIX17899.1 structural protein [Synechococcus phage ACG-2014b]AIX18115.1 structural protein [Synechococcus phage ACG-2014b]
MARQGLLAQSKPAATTDTLLYSTSVDESASAVLKIANDGTGAAYRVAVRDYDQKLVLDASTYKLHKGDVITSYRVNVDTAFAASVFTPGQLLTSVDSEKTLKFESVFIPDLTTIFVKEAEIRDLSTESFTGTFAVGDTITKGTGSDTTTAVVFSASTDGEFLGIGPSTINGSGAEFTDGDEISSTSGGASTISVGGIGTGVDKFIFSNTSGGVYSKTVGDVFGDRTYRFDVADSSMSGRLFQLSTTEGGEFGPDLASGTADDGTEYVTGKTTNGTAGSSGAYVQFDFAVNATPPATLYYYDDTVAAYGGVDEAFSVSTSFTYDEFFAFDLSGTWSNTTDSFEVGGITYTIESQTAGPYGTVVDYTGTALKVILGVGSAEFAGSDTFSDVPKSNTADRTDVTVSSVTTAQAAIDTDTYIAVDSALSANAVDNVTSLVVGPGQRVHVYSATQNNVFSLIGFEDVSSEFTTRVFGQS